MLRFRFLSLIALSLLVSASFSATKPPVAKPTPAPTIPKVVRAQTFELTDAAGKTRAWLGIADDGATVLKLLDKEGKPKVLVGSNGEIKVLDAEGNVRVTAGAIEDEYGIAVFDSKGAIRADVRVDSDDNPLVTVRDSTGGERGTLLTLEDDPFLILNDGKENGAKLALHVEGSLPMLSLWDTAGKARASYSLMESGAPLLQMTNADGKILAQISTGGEHPNLILESQQSNMAAFLGFTDDTDLSLLLQNGQDKTQIGLLLYGTNPTFAIAHENGNPAASMRIGDDGAPYVRTSDKDNVTIWKSP